VNIFTLAVVIPGRNTYGLKWLLFVPIVGLQVYLLYIIDPKVILAKQLEGARSASCQGYNAGFELVIVFGMMWINCVWNLFKGLVIENFVEKKENKQIDSAKVKVD
jgi:hypothetical protein